MAVANEAEGWAEAARRIRLCRETRAEELDLGGLMLTEVPEEVYAGGHALSWLKRLYLGTDTEAREKPQLVYSTGRKDEKRCNALRALPGTLFDALTQVEHLDLAHNGLKGLPSEIAGLTALTDLNLWDNGLGAEGARHLAGLTALTRLNVAGNGLEDLSPLMALDRLVTLNVSGCNGREAYIELWTKPHLAEVVFEPGRLPGVPAELLSKDPFSDNCLPRLREYFAALAGGKSLVTDIKVMLLGNGRVGKTKIARRLVGESYGTDDEPSTHGVQVKRATLPMPAPNPDAHLKIWDFGGQDIYHGTHALFLKSRAVFPVVWTPKWEGTREHILDGVPYRNQPLPYWLAYVREMSGAQSPVLVIQSQADGDGDEAAPPIPPELLEAFKPRPEVLAYSAKTNLRRGRLDGALVDAVATLRSRDGEIFIPASWNWVQLGLEELVRLDVEKAERDGTPREHRLFALEAFRLLCETARREVGPVADGVLLQYLHDTGTVFYREGLFGDRLILDQQWALDAVYAVFDRQRSHQSLLRLGGRFTAGDLAEWVWNEAGHSPDEQRLFLSFMEQCGICFRWRGGPHEPRVEAEYIAPDMLLAASSPEAQALVVSTAL